MKIETKFNCSDYVWFMYKDKPMLSMITRIKTLQNYSSSKLIIEYGVHVVDDAFYTRYEEQVFATKEELIASL